MKFTDRMHNKSLQCAAVGQLLSMALLLIFVAATGSAHAQIAYPSFGDIGTVAGIGNINWMNTCCLIQGNGYTGDGGLATAAELNYPMAVAVDAAGNVYIADWQNNRIREVSASTGIIITVAGNGTAGYSGDGGPATSAQLNYPDGVAVDLAGNIFIADSFNNVVREVTFSASRGVQVITTVAGNGSQGYSGDGGPAIGAQLAAPWGLAVDADGNLYIADLGNFRIRMVSATTGNISTVAGNGDIYYNGDGVPATSASMNPVGVAVDASGNIYIADDFNNLIREVTASTGYISTVAGNGINGFSGDSGPATSAELNMPSGVAVDISGNIYIVDGGNERIRLVTASTGYISTLAGDGYTSASGDGGYSDLAELGGPEGVAVDLSGNTYIADMFNHRIRVVNGTPPSIPSLPTPTQPTLPVTSVAAPYESNVTVTVNGTSIAGDLNYTNHVECNSSGCRTVTIMYGDTVSAANDYTIGYAITMQDATSGALVECTILENGAAHFFSTTPGGQISFSVSGGTTLSGTCVATENGVVSPTYYMNF